MYSELHIHTLLRCVIHIIHDGGNMLASFCAVESGGWWCKVVRDGGGRWGIVEGCGGRGCWGSLCVESALVSQAGLS